MADQQAADRLYSEATAKLNAKGGGFFGFGASKTERYEEAADKFRDAGNMYRQVRDMQNSGKAFERAAEVHERYLSDSLESAKLLQDAFKSYKEASPADAVRCLQRSCQLYTAKGNFRRAADLMSELAAVYETKLEDNSKALECLETAITWYTDEGIPACVPCR
jgi:alpha-soluble NSF attachment protein